MPKKNPSISHPLTETDKNELVSAFFGGNDLASKIAAQRVAAQDIPRNRGGSDEDGAINAVAPQVESMVGHRGNVIRTEEASLQAAARLIKQFTERFGRGVKGVVQEGAVVSLSEKPKSGPYKHYFVVPGGAGRKIPLSNGEEVICVSPETPVAIALMDKGVGDMVALVRGNAMKIAGII